MEKHVLSKSTFIRGLQCLKSLYLHKHRPFLRDKMSALLLNKFDRGHDVGALAHQLFPKGENCAPHHPAAYRKSIEKTLKLVEDKFPVLYEATFQAEGVLVMVDILVFNGLSWDMYEVKSSLKVSQTYLYDVALQYYVLQKANLSLGKAYILHVNQDYLYPGGDIDPLLFFNKVDLTAEVVDLQDKIKLLIDSEKQVLESASSPAMDIGPWCFLPYACDFMGHCWKNEPLNSVARLQSIPPHERFLLKENGIFSWNDLQEHHLKDPILSAEVVARYSGKPFVNKEELQYKLEGITIPAFAYIVAAENAIPQFPETHPFEPVPLLWGFNGNEGEAINIASSREGQNPIELCQKDAFSVGLGSGSVFFTWGNRATHVLHRLLPESQVEDLEQWLWSSFLYFPLSREDSEPWLFASQVGLMDAPVEKSASEDILRKLRKDENYGSSRQMSIIIQRELAALKLIFQLIKELSV
jgi:hypothetical protein